MSEIKAQWSASLDCKCPHCNEDVDLLDEPYFWQGRKSLNVADRVKDLDVTCPGCGAEFCVDCEW